MIKAKKRKILKTSLILGSGALLTGAIFGITFGAINQHSKAYIYASSDLNKPNLTNVTIKLIPSQVSGADANTESAKKDENDKTQVKTTLLFTNSINNKEIKKIILLTNSDEELQMQIQNLIPNGYNFDTSKYADQTTITAEIGKENVIYIVPEIKSQNKTTFIFYTQGEDGAQETVGNVEKDNNDVDSNSNFDLSTLLPDGYGFVNSQIPSFLIGYTNRFNVKKLEVDVTFSLKFMSNNKQIGTLVPVKAHKGQIVNILRYLPEGYKLAEGVSENVTADNNTFEIQLAEIPRQIITTLNFVEIQEGKEINVDSQKITTDQFAQIDYTKYLSSNYQLAPNQPDITIKLGQVNTIKVTKIKKIITTTVRFIDSKDSTTIGQPITIQTYEGDNIEFQPAWVPVGYKLVSAEPVKINPNQINNIIVNKIVNKVTATVQYKWNGRLVSDPKIEGEEGAEVDLSSSSYIPNGFEIAKEPAQTVIVKLENKTFVINVIKKTIETSFKFVQHNVKIGDVATITTAPDATISIEDIKKFVPNGYEIVKKNSYAFKLGTVNDIEVSKIVKELTTTIIFKENGNVIFKSKPFKTLEGDTTPIDWQSLLPKGYHTTTSQIIIEKGKENVIPVAKDKIEYSYTLIFKDGGETVGKAEGKYFDDAVPSVIDFVPKGYKLVSSVEANQIPQNATKIYQVTPIIPPKKPVITKPNLTPEEKKQVQDIVNTRQGAYVNVNNLNIPDKPDFLPEVPKGKITQEMAAENARRLSSFTDLVNLDRDITADDLKDVFKEVWERNPDLVAVYAQYLNGQISMPGREEFKKSKQEIRQNARAQLEAAKQIMDSEKAAGRVPVFDITGNSWGYNLGINFDYLDDKYNPTAQNMIENNKSRFLGNGQKWNRQPSGILDGEYFGWDKFDISKTINGLTPEEDRDKVTIDPKTGQRVKKDDGLRVYLYSPTGQDEFSAGKMAQRMLTVDASNRAGYDKFLKILNENRDITMLRVDKIGYSDKNESLRDLLSRIPSTVKVVNLFFSTKDTTAIAGLENLHLDEVGIYTTIPNLDKMSDKNDWGIDPVGLKNTKFASFEGGTIESWEATAPGQRAASIYFNTIKPSKHNNFNDIKDGFDIALNKKQNWKIFNGNFGVGGYPTGIDLSLNHNIKSMKDLPLNQRVFRKLTLHADGDTFTLPINEIVSGQFGSLVVQGPDRAKMYFDNPNTHILHLTGTASDIGNNYGIHLYGLLEAGKQSLDTIMVDNLEAKQLIESSQAWGTFGSSYKLIVKNN
ncbi:putative immunoglobulin-blocking virulence protein [Mycoplasma sp. 2634B]|uniref:putative immunoglobulin-blocking virulence protein n=1 Tax=Mycoplasma sp. 2634B TaxID=3401692 RepID=UPI003AAF5043